MAKHSFHQIWKHLILVLQKLNYHKDVNHPFLFSKNNTTNYKLKAPYSPHPHPLSCPRHLLCPHNHKNKLITQQTMPHQLLKKVCISLLKKEVSHGLYKKINRGAEGVRKTTITRIHKVLHTSISKM